MCSLYVLANYLLLCLNMSELVKLQGSVSLQMLHHHLKMKTAMKGHRNNKKKENLLKHHYFKLFHTVKDRNINIFIL